MRTWRSDLSQRIVSLFSVLILSACASPETRTQLKALRAAAPSKEVIRPIQPKDSDLIRSLENMKPITGFLWSYPKPSIEIVKSPPETPLSQRVLIFWLKTSVEF
jgi:hypothetical protein